MAKRDRPAVHVEPLRRYVELAPHALDPAEGLVHLEQVDVPDAPARLLEAALDRALRRGEEELRLVRELTLCDDARERLGAELAGPLLRRAVVQLRRVACRHRAALLERGLEHGERLEGRLARCLVLADHRRRALPAGHLDGNDLRVERALALRAQRLLVRPDREPVLVLARERALPRDELAAEPHMAVPEGVDETVGQVRVLDRVLAERKAGPRAAHEVGRVRHRLHAAGDDKARLSRRDLRRREHDALQARAADLVHGRARDAVRDPGAERRLPRWRLADAGLDDVAHEYLVHLVGLHAGALERAPDRDRAELWRRERREPAEERADRRARGAEDDGAHVRSSRRRWTTCSR